MLFGGRVPYFRDVSSQFYPDSVFVSDALRRGVWPLWNPAVDAGSPYLLAYPVELALLGIILVMAFLMQGLMWSRGQPLDRWWQAGGPLLLVALLIGVILYALTTACARALAIAILPSFRRTEPIRTIAEPEPVSTSAGVNQSEGE